MEDWPARRQVLAPATQPTRERNHLAGRIEEYLHAKLERRLRARGWHEQVVGYVGYGGDEWVRVLGRIHLVPPGGPRIPVAEARGWRHYFVPSTAGIPVLIRVATTSFSTNSLPKGYVDERLPVRLPAGWATATLSLVQGEPVAAPVRIVGQDATVGLVSDIDDTVIVTMLTRPIRAFWNAFMRTGRDREAVPGMAALYGRILTAFPNAFVAYLSTGAWHSAASLREFLDREDYPAGPLLMTHWGPTRDGWFRSGVAHKRDELRRLFADFPGLRWFLVGDDAQHDPALYAEAAATEPGKVLAVLIRQLPPRRRVTAEASLDAAGDQPSSPHAAEPLRGSDGFGLLALLEAHGYLSAD